MINSILKTNNLLLLSFGKRNPETGRQDREHSVAILGSSRKTEETLVSREIAASVAKKLAQNDFDIWTGGCPGVAKAANQAAHEVNPKNSWAIEVKQFIHKALRDLGIFNLIKDKQGKPVVKDSGPERTIALMKECDHTLIFSGGTGSGQELWSNLEAKAYQCTLRADDLVVVNDNGFYDADLKKLDLMESDEFKLASHPQRKKLRELINKEVKINRKEITKKPDIERVATDIANHIIEEANKKSENDDQISLIECTNNKAA
jgi:predicted Rossmann-fold nucleotide-binding protein